MQCIYEIIIKWCRYLRNKRARQVFGTLFILLLFKFKCPRFGQWHPFNDQRPFRSSNDQSVKLPRNHRVFRNFRIDDLYTICVKPFRTVQILKRVKGVRVLDQRRRVARALTNALRPRKGWARTVGWADRRDICGIGRVRSTKSTWWNSWRARKRVLWINADPPPPQRLVGEMGNESALIISSRVIGNTQ